MSASGFKHIGRVVALSPEGEVSVQLDKMAACDGCRAKGKCSVSGGESTTSVMRVMSDLDVEIGDLVMVSITYKVGWIAVLFSYITPLFLFLMTIITLISCGVTEGVAALITFGVVALYFLVLYSLRGRFEQVVEFQLSKRYVD